MTAIYYLLGIALVVMPFLFLAGMIKPSFLQKILGKHATRGKIALMSIATITVVASIMSAVEPANLKQERLQREAKKSAQQLQTKIVEPKVIKPRTETKLEEEKRSVDFVTETQQDSNLPSGQAKTIQVGVKGEKTITYNVTYTEGVETKRELKSEILTTKPINKIDVIGTKVQAYEPTPSNPADATALCRDGTYSYSQNRRGTCSHHGGVAEWY